MRVYIIIRKTNKEVIFTTANRTMALRKFMKLVNKEAFKLVIAERG